MVSRQTISIDLVGNENTTLRTVLDKIEEPQHLDVEVDIDESTIDDALGRLSAQELDVEVDVQDDELNAALSRVARPVALDVDVDVDESEVNSVINRMDRELGDFEGSMDFDVAEARDLSLIHI